MDGANQGKSRPACNILKILALFIVVCIVMTTITHYVWPELTGVPSHPVTISNLVTGDITVAVLGIAAFYHGRRTMGATKATAFLVSAVIFSGFEETAWILSGRFGIVAPTYYFTYGGLWFFEIPVYTCIAWYLICYCGYSMVKQLFPRLRSTGVAALVAAFGTCWDLWLDPVVCNRHLVSSLPDMWIWLSPSGVRLFGIPILNFAGWFGVIFTIIYIFDKKLRPVEKIALKNVGVYYLFLTAGWGVLFASLHIVGAVQYVSTDNLLPVVFGAPVDPVVAGTASVAAILTLAFFVLLVIGSIIITILMKKRQVGQIIKTVPAVLIGWWVFAGVGMATQLLAVYPESSLVWLIITCSAYPIVLIVASLLNRAPMIEGSRRASS